MIISHEHHFIFLKTTKTAGTSIEIALSQHCGPADVITPIAQEDEVLRQELGFRGPQNYKAPLRMYGARDWSRLVLRGRKLALDSHTPAPAVRRVVGPAVWNEYFKFTFERNPYDKAISRYYWSTRDTDPVSIDEYVATARPDRLSNWHIYTRDGQVAVDYVGRFEALQTDLKKVWEKIGLPGRPRLPNAKGSHRKDRRHYSQVLTHHARAKIDHICARELAEFNYHFDAL